MVHAEKVFPRTPPGYRRQQAKPDATGQCEFSPNASTELFVPDRGTDAEKSAHEQKWGVEKAETEFENGGQDPDPPGHPRDNERPEFFVPLSGQVCVMQLMG